jgi:hypothetical protein
MDIINYLAELHDKCLNFSEQLRFDKHSKLHFALVSLYGSIIELVGCMLILMRNNAKLGIPSLFRTFLETYVEFHNLVRDPSYGYFMEASSLKEQLKLLKIAKKKDNPYLANISSLPNLLTIISKYERQDINLRKLGYKLISIYERFKRANMTEEYESIYNFLSRDSHSNISALLDRHADIDGNDYRLTYYKNEPIEKYLQYMDLAAGLLISATKDIHDHFVTPELSWIEDFHKKLERIRLSYKI